MAKDAFWSPTAVQVAPASVVRQMPPCAPPIKTVLPVGSDGSTAIAVMRPVTGLKKELPVVGVGPMEVQGFVTVVARGAAHIRCGKSARQQGECERATRCIRRFVDPIHRRAGIRKSESRESHAGRGKTHERSHIP